MFSFKEFIRHWFYHMLTLLFFGPFGAIFIVCLENLTYTGNMGFLPSKEPFNLILYIAQFMTWLLFAVPTYLWVRDQYESEEYHELHEHLDAFPLVLLVINIVTRCIIVGVRYGTTHTITLNSMRNGTMDEQAFNERLLKSAWITMTPDTLLQEIGMGMDIIGCQDKYFRFKTLTPLYPTMREKLTDPGCYDGKDWNLSTSIKLNKSETRSLSKTLKIFKLN